ncbi:MAG: SixA phosphatase family protein, partial [Bacteroidota bacterium]
MKIHLLRHSKTEKISSTGKDFDRKLMEKGVRQSSEMLKFLELKSFENTNLYYSSAQRTKETFDLACSKFKFNQISFHRELYLAGLEELLHFIWNLKIQNDIFIIGHNEGLSELASYLSGSFIHLKTSGYIQLEFACESSEEISKDSRIIPQSLLISSDDS